MVHVGGVSTRSSVFGRLLLGHDIRAQYHRTGAILVNARVLVLVPQKVVRPTTRVSRRGLRFCVII